MIRNSLLFVFVLLFFGACSEQIVLPIPSRFDSDPHLFTYEAVDTVLTAENNVPWFFSELRVNGRIVDFKDASIRYRFKNTVPQTDQKLGQIVQFENDWFSVEKISNEQIRVRLAENMGTTRRSLRFSINVASTATHISCVQGNP